MVLRRRLDYRLNGFHFPSFPSVPMSAKGKRSVRKRVVENHICAFDLLASVAGKLIDGEKSSATCDIPGSLISNSKQKIFIDEFPIQNSNPKVNTTTCSSFISRKDNYSRKEFSKTLKLSGTSYVSLCSSASKKIAKRERGSSVSSKVCTGKNLVGYDKINQSLEYQTDKPVIDENPVDCYTLDNPVISNIKSPLMKSEGCLEVHISTDKESYNSFFSRSWDDLDLPVNRDDDENFSHCIHPCASSSKASKPYLGEHRLRKLLARRYWRVDLDAAKPVKLPKSDLKHAFRRRKICYSRRSTRSISFRRRNLFKRYSASASSSYNGFSRAGVLNLFGEEFLKGSSSAALSSVSGIPSTIKEQVSSYSPEDFHMKLSIKSFIVPELYIEIPETSTVGSLKRTVMEAISAIIGSGLHVGVLLQGKDFRDDDMTLIQAGISHASELDELSFTLEPSSNFEKPHPFLPYENIRPMTRISAGTSLDTEKSVSSSYPALLSTIICDHDSINYPSETPSASCQVLTARSALSVEKLSVVPAHNLKRPELVQRRIRKPFTVSEVEALVQAVEKIGTGRWRDVKLSSFDDAKHRTYVDLKDKWKTLVHTAGITPQKRRGEPVPQELLDRVLHAHAYWSQQQVKQLQAKLHVSYNYLPRISNPSKIEQM